jgi:hypothetical protein
MSVESIVESFVSGVKLDMEQGRRLAESTSARQVWFLAIAGFALLNSPMLWEGILDRPLTAGEYLLMAAPWIIAAIAAVCTHYVGDLHEIKRHNYFVNRLAELDLFLEATREGKIDPSKWRQLVNDDTEGIRPLKKDADASAAKVNRTERLAFTSIAAGLAWTVIVPAILR